jgi:hypothetical protein
MPGKKPLSSMSPTIVFLSAEARTLGPLILVLGASGGPKIISEVVEIFANMAAPLGMCEGNSEVCFFERVEKCSPAEKICVFRSIVFE